MKTKEEIEKDIAEYRKAKHRAKYLEYHREYYIKNKIVFMAKDKLYREAHRAEKNKYMREYYRKKKAMEVGNDNH